MKEYLIIHKFNEIIVSYANVKFSMNEKSINIMDKIKYFQNLCEIYNSHSNHIVLLNHLFFYLININVYNSNYILRGESHEVDFIPKCKNIHHL